MTTYKTPGVFVGELPKLPPSVKQVETAIPCFFGFTERDEYNGSSILNKPTRINSLKEYELKFGFPEAVKLKINITSTNELKNDVVVPPLKFRMYYSLQLYFANGGGPCFITSIAKYSLAGATAAAKYIQMKAGLDAGRKNEELTILLFPDALSLDKDNFYQIYNEALMQCGELKDRVVIVDVFSAAGNDVFTAKATEFRTGIGSNSLSYGAAYYPYLRTTLLPLINERTQAVTGGTLPKGTVLCMDKTKPGFDAAKSLYHANRKLYSAIKKSLEKNNLVLPPSPAVAGVYGATDAARGVWKAPVNVALNQVKEPMVTIDDKEQGEMNGPPSGKSVNAIRAFSGKGVLVWGARTLAGNDNEWRYVPVRRFFNMVETSVKKATEPFVFEPNDAATWTKVRGMMENFLVGQWRAGALQGAKPELAFYVRVGLGETMTALDILEGRMIVEIGMAVLRPAEFMILRFSQKMMKQ